MLKSLCIKTNDNNAIEKIILEIEKLNLSDLYISQKSFSKYENLIFHYAGNNVQYFIDTIATALAKVIICLYEKTFLYNILNENYFYFYDSERLEILNICVNTLSESYYKSNYDTFQTSNTSLTQNIHDIQNTQNTQNTKNIQNVHDIPNTSNVQSIQNTQNHSYEPSSDSENFAYINRLLSIANPCTEYITEHKSIILDGFVRFRLYNYMSILDDLVDYSVNKYLIQREYIEFIKLLREYVTASESRCPRIHLIYSNNNVTLMNDNNIIIPINTQLSDIKFISDISFSQNDYCLNTLLTILPSEIVLHILSPEDEFIETIKLVFSDRITLCSSCNLCTEKNKLN